MIAPFTSVARRAACLLAASGLATAALAQNGDRKGEEQPPLPPDLVVPAAPALSPAQALDSFRLAPGLRVELVAAEPLVVDPVCVAFDGDGRLWVVEMRAYMPDVDGTGEEEPTGRVAILTDTDGDGVMDERVDFLDGLVLPRAILPYRDGALLIEPPELVFCRDTDGDGRADTREVIERGLGGIHSPEHAINGLRWSHDNWVVCANHRWRYREGPDGWERQPTNGGGQWGLSLDAEGRAYFNSNSDPLRGDAYSSHYAVRNPNHGTAAGVNRRWARDMEVWPARITPGVNRGYQPATLRDDFTLRRFTGACGPLAFLGDALPADMRGDAFIAEPCGNLIKRYVLEPDGLGVRATNAYEGREFLSSTDERFRPVELVDGPDGGLYVVDLYRGLIQHRLFVTTWLRNQVIERGLAEPLGLGRIWRVVAEDHVRETPPRLSAATWTELVEALDHPSGWWRITAQRVLVEEADGLRDPIELLRTAVREHTTAHGRAHALWSLQGIGYVDRATLLAALADDSARVRRAAVRSAELLLSTGDAQVLERVAALARSEDRAGVHQIALSLGEANTPAADAVLADIALQHRTDGWIRGAVLSSCFAREGQLLDLVLADATGAPPDDGQVALLRELARAIARGGRHEALDALLDHALALGLGADDPGARRADALAEGWLAGRPPDPRGEPGPVALRSEPRAHAALQARDAGDPDTPLARLLAAMTWPGGPNATGDPVRPLTRAELARFERGREVYAAHCASCHHASGLGAAGLAPPLRHSTWLLRDAETPARIVLGGLHGPIRVRDATWDLEMPSFDPGSEALADVLTYVRREWGHGADPVEVSLIERVREQVAARGGPWTAQELNAARSDPRER